MRWRVLLEITSADGVMTLGPVAAGERPGAIQTAASLGLSLDEGKAILVGVQQRLVETQTSTHCQARRRCRRCGSLRPVKDHRSRRLQSPFGTVDVRAPRFAACRCGMACPREYERIMALAGSSLPYRRARVLLEELLPLDEGPDEETIRQRTLGVGARLEQAALVDLEPSNGEPPSGLTMSIDAGHVSSVKTYQVRSFEVVIARAIGAMGRELIVSSMPAEAGRQTRQLRHLLLGLGAARSIPITILSDGAEGPRGLGEAASLGPVRHVLDWFHLSMRIQHVAQAVQGWATAVPTEP